MRSEGEELVRAFLRKWSTIELTDEARALLKADTHSVRTLLEIYAYDVTVIEDAEFAPDRHWFAARFKERYMGGKHA